MSEELNMNENFIIEEIIKNNIINIKNFEKNFSYKTLNKAYTYSEGEGFILKSSSFYFKFPFVEKTFEKEFYIHSIMDTLIKKENILKDIISLGYKIKENEINLFNLIKIKLFKEKILINYVHETIIFDYNDLFLIKIDREKDKLIFKMKNNKIETFDINLKNILNFDLIVYNKNKEFQLQDVKISYEHMSLIRIFIKIITDIIIYKLEELEKIDNNSIKIISL